MFARFVALAIAIGAALTVSSAQAAEPLKIGSKRFTESYIVGEILAQTARQAGVPARHLQGLGNTAILYAALRQGSIDAYPEYLGTIAAELLKLPAHDADLATVHRALADRGLGVAVPLGFSNSYGIAVLPAAGAARTPGTPGTPGGTGGTGGGGGGGGAGTRGAPRGRGGRGGTGGGYGGRAHRGPRAPGPHQRPGGPPGAAVRPVA
ncbi:MAG: hypothetical protein IPM01_13235 [Burkholderiaceae bacterium]|nr:hypothetical protein [Burkholderiaceae bacterium]